MSCWDTIADYALRSQGIGPKILPRSDFTLCQQVTLIGSGMIWNIYFAVLALGFGVAFGDQLGHGEKVEELGAEQTHHRDKVHGKRDKG